MPDSQIIRDGYMMSLVDRLLPATGTNFSHDKFPTRAPVKLYYPDLARSKSIFYGDELTWNTMDFLGLDWGSSTVILFPTLEPGWIYKYCVDTKEFTVVDDTDTVRFTIISNDIADWGIVWDIISSHQFIIYWSDGYGAFDPRNWFLEAIWYRGKKGPYGPDDDDDDDDDDDVVLMKQILAQYVDRYYTDAQEGPVFFRLKEAVPKEKTILQASSSSSSLITSHKKPQILRSNVPVRDANGDFSATNVEHREVALNGPMLRQRDAYLLECNFTLLLSVVFATISYRGKAVYEPWMLWEMWRWIFQEVPIDIPDRIFDMSPNWG